MIIIKKILTYSLPFLKLEQFFRSFIFKSPKIIVLTFHDIPESKLEELRDFLIFLQKYFKFISPSEFDDLYSQEKMLIKDSILVTFDDGFESSFNAWKKVFKPLGIRSMFFICPSFIGLKNKVESYVSKNLHMGELEITDVQKCQFPMSDQQIQDLIIDGNQIGSHSYSHQNIAKIATLETMKSEIVNSKIELKNKFNQEISSFAYPFGAIEHINKEGLDLISKNYKYCFSNVRGSNSLETSPFVIMRQNIDIHMSLFAQRHIVWGGLNFLYWKKAKALVSLLGRI